MQPEVFGESLFLLSGLRDLTLYSLLLQTSSGAGEGSILNLNPTVDPDMFLKPKEVFKEPIKQQHSLMVATGTFTSLNRRSVATAHQLTQSTASAGPSRQRFLKKKDEGTKEASSRAAAYYRRNTERHQEEKKDREAKITLYRRYRYGDFPDLCHDALAFLFPLRGLILKDKLIAKEFFISVVNTCNEKSDSAYFREVSMALDGILRTTAYSDSALISALINVVLQRPNEFRILPENLSATCKASGNFSLGALLIEECLIDKRAHEPEMPTEPPAKRAALEFDNSDSGDSEQNHWLQLAELYHCLSETDVITSILTNQLNNDDRLSTAVAKMTEGAYDDASAIFKDIIDQQSEWHTPNEGFCLDMCFDCLEYMGDWSAFARLANSLVDSYDELWDGGNNQNTVLPKIVTSEARLIIEEIQESNEFAKITETWLENRPKAAYLKENFGKELAMLAVAAKAYSDSQLVTDNSLKQFLAEWGRIDLLADKVRLQKLADVRLISEIHTTVKGLTSDPNEGTFSTLERLYDRTVPANTDSIKFWSHLVTYRSYFQRTLCDSAMDDALDEHKASLKKAVIGQQTRLVALGLTQNNLTFAKQVFQRGGDDRSLHGKLVTHHLKFEEAKRRHDLIQLCVAYQNFQWVIGAARDVDEEIAGRAYEFVAEIGKILSEHCALKGVPADPNEREIFHKYLGPNDPRTPANYLAKTVENLLKSVELSSTNQGEVYYKIAQYSFDAVERNIVESSLAMQMQIIDMTSLAMQHGNENARLLFPRILQFSDDIFDPAHLLGQQFMASVAHVPEWMFLGWIPQILAQVSLSHESTLDPLVSRLAQEYPNALVYPLRLTITREKTVRPFIAGLLRKINTPLLQKFANALSCLCLPSNEIMSHLSVLLSKGKDLVHSKELDAGEKYKELLHEAVNEILKNEDLWGRAQRNTILPYKPTLERLLNSPSKLVFTFTLSIQPAHNL